MATQEQWRRDAYERWVGGTGNSSMGTMANRAGYNEYLARTKSSQFTWPTKPAYKPSPVAIPLPPIQAAPVVAVLPAIASATLSAPAQPAPERTAGEKFIDAVGDIAAVSDAEDFWDASGWLFGPIEDRAPEWTLWALCTAAAAIAFAWGWLSVGLQGPELAAPAIIGFFAPLAGYAGLRIAVSALTLVVIWGLFLAFWGAVAAAAVGILYVIGRFAFGWFG